VDVNGPRLVLVIDTATRRAVLGLCELDGEVIAADGWTSAHRHGEELLSRLGTLLAQAAAEPTDLAAVVVGTGPGSFTGLRIGLATAKTLSYALGVPLLGIPTAHALALAASGNSEQVIVTLPAGARDRYLARLRVADGRVAELVPPELVASNESFAGTDSAPIVAIDLDPPEVSAAAAALGRKAVDGLVAALARLGAAALATGQSDDVAELVPAYVSLPRGVSEAAASVEWSPDLR
jgi:tRNA threonylcarbamoyladenosine biosynthesis protein TsaB